MKRLFVFGDSFTDKYIISNNTKYVNWKGYTPKCYHEILGDALNLPVLNFAESYGMDNYAIFQKICDNIHNMKNDVVVINWSEPVRFRMVDTVTGKWRTILPLKSTRIAKGLPYVNGVNNETIEDIFTNRTHPLWLKEVNGWINLINKALNQCTVIHWTWYNDTSRETISEETNGEVFDFHYSEKGHKDLAEWILNQVSNGTNNSPFIKEDIL
jgi:hypothetical protein